MRVRRLASSLGLRVLPRWKMVAEEVETGAERRTAT